MKFMSRLFKRDSLWAFLLIALVFISYARVFNADFIWDDESHLTRNPCIVGPLGFEEIWTSAQAVYYPLVLTTFWAVHKVVGLSPWPYHFLNVLLHAGSAVLLWQVLRQLHVPALLYPGDTKQAFRGHVACGNCPVHLVAKRAGLLA